MPWCGKFKISRTAEVNLSTRDDRRILSGWIREQTNLGDVPFIKSSNLDEIASRKAPPLAKLVERLLIRMGEKTTIWDEIIAFDDPEFIAIVYGGTSSNVGFIVKMLIKQGYLLD